MNELISMFDEGGGLEHLAKIKSNDWKWSFKDYPKEKNGLKVFSCFAGGGGSTMGYKLAGCDVIGCLEIDPKMNEVYVLNHKPKYNYLMDIREFNKLENLPEELYNLDILDGSPPCTTFSMAGQREESWGKKKKFREGQQEQTLDDLSFVFIDTVEKLKPKVVIIENVEGLIKGEAWKYVQQIYLRMDKAGYNLKHYLLKGENMGVPQTRHRVFFIGIRKDIAFDYRNLDMDFDYEKITYEKIKSGISKKIGLSTETYKLIKEALPNEKSLGDVNARLYNKNSAFQTYLVGNESIIPTLRSKPDVIDRREAAYISKETMTNSQTFPQDYNYGNTTYSRVGYICGMSVPPLMIKRIMERLDKSGLFNYR